MTPGTFDPDRTAVLLAETGERLTYGELEDRSVRLARLLADRGLGRGDRVALLSPNSVKYSEVHWAVLRSGLLLTAINVHLSVEEQLYILRDCGAKALVVSADLARAASALAEGAPEVAIRLAYDGQVAGFEDYDAALAASSAEPLVDQPAGGDMLYSSGTTGRPKAIRASVPERQIDEPGDLMLTVFGGLYGFDEETVYLSPAPMYHAAPMRFCSMIQMRGGTVVMMRRFDAETALSLITEHRVTHSQWVPTMFVRMLKLPEPVRTSYDVRSLRVAIHAAAPCPVEVKQQMIDWWGPILHEYYAATEAAGVTLVGADDWLAHPGTVGKAGLGTLHVCDQDDPDQPELGVGEDGLVYFERDVMPFEYHGDADQTRGAQHPHHDNWATTGDIGHLDDEGFLYLTDRRAFMIISGGVNVYPQEVENALTLHPAVYDVAVIGVPDDEMGEAVTAVVVPAEGVEPTPSLGQELIDHVRASIAHYKAPRTVDFVDSLPRTPTGKLQKRKVRERYL